MKFNVYFQCYSWIHSTRFEMLHLDFSASEDFGVNSESCILSAQKAAECFAHTLMKQYDSQVRFLVCNGDDDTIIHFGKVRPNLSTYYTSDVHFAHKWVGKKVMVNCEGHLVIVF